MNILAKSFLLLTCLLFISGISFASDKHHRSHNGISLAYNIGGHQGLQLHYFKKPKQHYDKHHSAQKYSNQRHKNNYNARRYYKQRNQHHNKYYKAPSYSYKSYLNDRNKRRNNYVYQKPCHSVTKRIIGRDGYSHLVGGTMCYNSHGQGYIVAGSRYHKQ